MSDPTEFPDFNEGELLEALETEKLRDALRAAYAKLGRAANKIEPLSEALYEGAKDGILALPRPKIKPYVPSKRKGKEEIALWHLTDWQGSKVTETYNSETMRERVRRFTDRAIRITEIQRTDHPVNDCAILLGGDMIEGLFNYPTQPYEIDLHLIEQIESAADEIDILVRRAAQMHRVVDVFCEWGNHGRVGSKRSAVPRGDNMDRMCYILARVMSRDLENVHYHISDEDIMRVELGNYRALLIHGDEVGRNGFASPMTIVRHADRWRSGAYRVASEPWEFRDIYMGHYHTHAEWPMANGEGALFQTGSTESDNRYARDNLASQALPSQRLHFINPREGAVTAQYKIRLHE